MQTFPLIGQGSTVEDSENTDGARADKAVETAARLSFLALLVYSVWTIVAPFLTIFMWSAILTIALYPVYERLSKRLGPTVSAAIITLLNLFIVVGPVLWLGYGLISGLGHLVDELQGGFVIPSPPDTVRQWPVIGEFVHEAWRKVVSNLKDVLLEIVPKLKPLAGQIISLAQEAFVGLMQFLLAILISGVLFGPGPRLVELFTKVMERVLHSRGRELVRLAGATVRNVSRGVMGVALLQSVLAGIGFAAAGMKAPGMLAFFAFVLSVVQIGPSIIILPSIIWSWMSMDALHAALFTAYMVPVGLVDNVLRPVLVARGLTTPMMVILIGVIGGAISHGLIGLFFGPIVTAVVWELLVNSVETQEPGEKSRNTRAPS